MTKAAKPTKSTQQAEDQPEPRSPVDADSKKTSAIAEFHLRSEGTMLALEKYSNIPRVTINAELKGEFKKHFGKSKFVPNNPFLNEVESLMNTKAEITLKTLTELALHSLIDERFHDIAKKFEISIIQLTKLINDKNPDYLIPSSKKFFDDSENWSTVDDIMAKIKPKKEKKPKNTKASSSSSNSSEDDSSQQVAMLGLLQKLNDSFDHFVKETNDRLVQIESRLSGIESRLDQFEPDATSQASD